MGKLTTITLIAAIAVIGATLTIPHDAMAASIEAMTVKTNGSNLNIRDGAGSNNTSVGKFKNGARVDVYSTKQSGTGCKNGWSKIASGYYINKWVCSDYLVKATQSTPTNNVTNDYIDIRNMTYTPYKSDIQLKFYGRTKSAQNFSIANLHTNNETYYFTTVNKSYVTKKSDISDKIYETYVLKVSGKNLNDTSKGQTMSIPYSGHGQTFQLSADGKSFWTNSDAGTNSYSGTPYKYSNGKYWGSKNYGLSEYTFGNSNGQNKQRLYLNGAYKSELKGTIDYKSNKMAIVSGSTAYIVPFNGNTKLHKSYNSKITLKRTYGNTKLNSQGYAYYNNYFYEYLNDSDNNLYIACYNAANGKNVYIKKFNLGSNKEAEGLQIIDGEMFIGVKDTETKKFTIGTFK